jgi:type VI secretion system protein ImpG
VTADPRLDDYQAELAALKRAAAEFAERHPAAGRALLLGPDGSAEPVVERLLETAALAAAQLKGDVARERGALAEALLAERHPDALRPFPSIALARFLVEPARARDVVGQVIPAGTALVADAPDGAPIRWRTIYPVTPVPLEVMHAGFEAPRGGGLAGAPGGVLRLRLAARGATFGQLGLDRLRFHLAGDAAGAEALHDLLACHVVGIALDAEGGWSRRLSADALRLVGFGPDEAVLPDPPTADPAYRLMRELLHAPAKFRFLDVIGLDLGDVGELLDLRFLLGRMPARRPPVDRATFVLGATPIINLFEKTSEPIRVDRGRAEQPVVADARRADAIEVVDVLTVAGAQRAGVLGDPIAPLAGAGLERPEPGEVRWLVRRRPAAGRFGPASTAALAFVDATHRPVWPAAETVHAGLLCADRGLPRRLDPGTVLRGERLPPGLRAHLLDRPTPLVPPSRDPAAQLLAQRALDGRGLFGPDAGPIPLRALLGLLAPPDDPAAAWRIGGGVADVTVRPVMRRVGSVAWRGVARGLGVEILLDAPAREGQSLANFGAALANLLGGLAPADRFVELSVVDRSTGEARQWPPTIGTAPYF